MGRVSFFDHTLWGLSDSLETPAATRQQSVMKNENCDISATTPKELRWVDRFTGVLDTKFVIPGTNVRFGLDFLLGLIPGVGDTISLGFSGVLIATMAKHGASPRLVVRMLVNVLVDAVVGAVPFLGNVFDLFFKANSRNLNLMQEFYVQDKHQGSVWPVLLMIGMVITAAMIVVVVAVAWIFRWVVLGLTG